MGFDNVNVNVSGGQSIIKALQNYNTIILKPNIVDNRNVLTQEMMSERHTKYIIRWNYSLEGATINVPEDCIIEFAGGTIDNGTIVGNNTMLMYSKPIDEVCLAERQGTFIYNTTVADEEDITSASGQLKFKDRPATNGMGRKILRKNIVNGINTLTQSMINQANTIYVIQYDFTLGENITILANCVLEFDGGSISGAYTLTGNNTGINAKSRVQIFSGVDIQGTWNVTDIYIEWMNIPNNADCGNEVRSICRLQNDNIQQNVYFPNTELSYTPEEGTYITPNDLRQFIIVSSNTCVYLPNNIIVNGCSLDHYQVISITGKSNITICGGGKIIGDIESHIGNTGQWGMGINITRCNNIHIKDISFDKCWGDGVYIGGSATAIDNYDDGNTSILLENIHCLYNRRQGLSVVGPTNGLRIVNCSFNYTGGIASHLPSCGIDFECNDDYSTLKNVVFKNCEFISNTGGGVLLYRGHFKNITFSDCIFDSNHPSVYDIKFEGNINTFENIQFIQCDINRCIACSEPSEESFDVSFNDCSIKRVMAYDIAYYNKGRFNLYFNNCIMNIPSNYNLGSFNPIYVRNDSFNLYFNRCDILVEKEVSFCYLYENGKYVDIEFNNCKLSVYTDLVSNRIENCDINVQVNNSFACSYYKNIYIIKNNTFNIKDNYYIKTHNFGESGPLEETNLIIDNNFFIADNQPAQVIITVGSLTNVNLSVRNNKFPFSGDNEKLLSTNTALFKTCDLLASPEYYDLKQTEESIIQQGFSNGIYGWYLISEEINAYNYPLKLVVSSPGMLTEMQLYYSNGKYFCEVIKDKKPSSPVIIGMTVLDGKLYIQRSNATTYAFLTRYGVGKELGSITYIGNDLPSSTTTIQVLFLYHYGSTTNRNSLDTDGLYIGYEYFDTTIGKPIYWTGTAWVDATGATV